MHIDEADTALFKKWITPKLEKISDADSDVLADYVIALVKTDDSDETVKQNCLDSLPDFLHDHTASFVDEVTDAVRTKSFLPGCAPHSSSALSPEAPAFNPPTGPAVGTNRQTTLPGLIGAHHVRGDQSRKRTREGSESRDGRDPHYSRGAGGERQMKHSRRGGRNGGRGGFAGQEVNMGNLRSPMASMPTMAGMSTPPSGFPAFDPSNPLAGLLAMQAMGFPLPGMSLPNAASQSSFGQSTSPARELPPGRKERCKDYDTKGFCALGSVCPYEHGTDHIVVPPSAEEYDPNQASLAVEPHKGLNGHDSSDRGRGRGRGRGDRVGHGGRGRAPFSHAGPVFDRSNTTVVVEQIPEDHFDEQIVRNFFSEFGNVVDVQMHAYKRLAIVKFEDHNSARRAYDSPKVIFDNRFVKVYWYKPDSVPTPPAPANGAAKSSSPPTSKPDEEMIDPAEIERKQAEAQRAHEERLKKRQEAETRREEVEKKLKVANEAKKKLLERLAAKTGSPVPATSDGSVAASADVQDSAKLEQELAALQAEASNLGLPAEHGANGVSQMLPAPRGRGGYRARGTFVPRGRGRGYAPFRGPYRGRGGFTGSTYAGSRGGVMRLDNRPKRVAVGGVEAGTPKDEALRQHLINNFDYESIEQHPERKDAQVVTFKERYVAETFINSASNMPEVGEVQLSWMPNVIAAPSIGTASSKMEQTTSDGDLRMEEQANGSADQGTNGGDADYDVADDEDRWMAA